jgi:hypothetical protein
MMITTPLLAGSGLMLNIAATVPTYDIKPTCRAAIELSGMRGRTVEMCEASEAQARKEIVKDWSTFTESAENPVEMPANPVNTTRFDIFI